MITNDGRDPYLALLPRRREVLSGLAGGRELPARGLVAPRGLELLQTAARAGVGRRRAGRRGRGGRRRGGGRRRDGRGRRRRGVGICGGEWICVMGGRNNAISDYGRCGRSLSLSLAGGGGTVEQAEDEGEVDSGADDIVWERTN